MPKANETVQEIHKTVVGNLSLNDCLRLATLILNNLTQQNIDVIDTKDTWTD